MSQCLSKHTVKNVIKLYCLLLRNITGLIYLQWRYGLSRKDIRNYCKSLIICFPLFFFSFFFFPWTCHRLLQKCLFGLFLQVSILDGFVQITIKIITQHPTCMGQRLIWSIWCFYFRFSPQWQLSLLSYFSLKECHNYTQWSIFFLFHLHRSWCYLRVENFSGTGKSPSSHQMQT